MLTLDLYILTIFSFRSISSFWETFLRLPVPLLYSPVRRKSGDLVVHERPGVPGLVEVRADGLPEPAEDLSERRRVLEVGPPLLVLEDGLEALSSFLLVQCT